MNTRRDHDEEPERPEGGRVGGVLDSEDRGGAQTGYPGPPDPARPAAAADREPVAPDSAPVAPHAGAPDDTGRDGGAGRVGLLNDVAGLREEWQRVQGTFVDDPPRAVHEASVLVDRMLDEIRVNVGSGHTSETTSTEDLRVSFQRYREFFERLLSA